MLRFSFESKLHVNCLVDTVNFWYFYIYIFGVFAILVFALIRKLASIAIKLASKLDYIISNLAILTILLKSGLLAKRRGDSDRIQWATLRKILFLSLLSK